MMWWTPGGWEWGIPMMLGMLVFWGLVAWAIVAVVRGVNRPTGKVDGRRPEAILAERFASGEIDEAEYRARLDVLRRSPTVVT